MNGLTTLIGLAGVPGEQVVPGVLETMTALGARFCPPSDDDIINDLLMVAVAGDDRATVHWPNCGIHDDPAAALSRRFSCPALMITIHEEDYWMMALYVGGEEVGSFSPMPGIVYGLEEESALQDGDEQARILAEHWPGLQAEAVRKYLITWDRARPGTAYPDDLFGYGEDLQALDLMQRLGLPWTSFIYIENTPGVAAQETFLAVRRDGSDDADNFS